LLLLLGSTQNIVLFLLIQVDNNVTGLSLVFSSLLAI